MLEEIHLVPPVLDVGCGDGAFASFTFDHQLEIGLDLAIGSSPYLSRSYRTLIQASITDIPLKDSSVRTAISNCVMEHVDSLEQGLREVCRVLQSGGEFALTAPSARSKEISFVARLPLFRYQAQRWLEWYNSRLHIVNFLTPSQWQEMLEKNGFDIVESKAYVQKPTMFWHTFFASLVLMGMQFLRGLHQGLKGQTTRIGKVEAHPKHNTLALLIGKMWFRLLAKGYTAPVADPSEGGYFFIRCRKR